MPARRPACPPAWAGAGSERTQLARDLLEVLKGDGALVLQVELLEGAHRVLLGVALALRRVGPWAVGRALPCTAGEHEQGARCCAALGHHLGEEQREELVEVDLAAARLVDARDHPLHLRAPEQPGLGVGEGPWRRGAAAFAHILLPRLEAEGTQHHLERIRVDRTYRARDGAQSPPGAAERGGACSSPCPSLSKRSKACLISPRCASVSVSWTPGFLPAFLHMAEEAKCGQMHRQSRDGGGTATQSPWLGFVREGESTH